MSSSKPSSWKVCVTCAHWGGNRQASTWRDRAEYDSNDDRGECVGGGWNRSEKSATHSCGSWVKWSVLK